MFIGSFEHTKKRMSTWMLTPLFKGIVPFHLLPQKTNTLCGNKKLLFEALIWILGTDLVPGIGAGLGQVQGTNLGRFSGNDPVHPRIDLAFSPSPPMRTFFQAPAAILLSYFHFLLATWQELMISFTARIALLD